ncbi:SCP-like protein [Ancylostoma caninum]|uniref:SCP-like protein n=1 Tax=Ancylostoma caninum TaxID=29170 RepID=A0A368H206_ANCCA|nr:SCP-like protein [Ancylostoma caninum]
MKSYLVILIAFYGVAHANDDEYENCTYRNEMKEMDDMDRRNFEETHNGRRSLVARGKVDVNNMTSMSLTASKMMAMEYDCNLENSAYESAIICSNTSSSTDENLYVIEEEDFYDPVVEAINWWSSEAFDYDQKKENLYPSTGKIPSFANLAWDTHTKVGCAVVKCDNGKRTHVVCRYGPKVQKEGQIYKTGEPCDDCPKKAKCWKDEGLCYTRQ